jgi:hypothetical protein
VLIFGISHAQFAHITLFASVVHLVQLFLNLCLIGGSSVLKVTRQLQIRFKHTFHAAVA